jgi:FAD/FMN-containing dehydrogenase
MRLYRSLSSVRHDISLHSFYRFFSTSSHTIATVDDINIFASIVGKANVIDGSSQDAIKYNIDWLRHYKGQSSCIILPRSTAEISAVLKHCFDRKISLVPQGGNTSLVGGSVPIEKEVVLSLSRLDTIESFNEDSCVVVCGAGVILQTLDVYLREKGYIVPLDLGAKGSCFIGGNVSTNAGGLRLLRYGSLHGSVLGLEVVKSNGQVLDMLTTLRKDNVGFDLKQLFIGAEGSLGIITRVALLTSPLPSALNVILLGVSSFDNCRSLLRLARTSLGEIISAVEFVDKKAMGLTLDILSSLSRPLNDEHSFYFFIETSGSHHEHDREKVELFLEDVIKKGLVTDGIVASGIEQARKIFKLREDVPLALAQRGHVFKYDVSLQMKDMYRLVEEMNLRLEKKGWNKKGVVTVGYGHIGDGNLHLNISTKGREQDYLKQLEEDIEPFVYERVLEMNGSISAEHGVGQSKPKWLIQSKSKEVVELMKDIKKLMDPYGIINPGKVLV